MDRELFFNTVDKIKNNIKYIMISTIYVTSDESFLIEGSIVGNNFVRENYKFKCLAEDMRELNKIVPDCVKNFSYDENNVLCVKEGIDYYKIVNIEEMYALNLRANDNNLNFFDLMGLLLSEDNVNILFDKDIAIPVKNLNYAKQRYSVSLKYLDSNSNWKTKKLLWFEQVPKLNEFDIACNHDISFLLHDYLADGSLYVLDNHGDVSFKYIYRVNIDKLSIVPMDIGVVYHLANREFLFTCLGELEYYKSYIEGVGLVDKSLRQVLDEPKESNYDGGYYDRIVTPYNIVYEMLRNTFDKNSNVNNLADFFRYNVNGNMLIYVYMYLRNKKSDVSSIEKDFESILRNIIGAYYFDAGFKGALFMFRNASDDYNVVKRRSSRIRKYYKDKIVHHNLYAYFMRAIFITYPHLLQNVIDTDLDNKIMQGGAYDTQITVVQGV